MHVIVDGYGANRKNLTNIETVTQFLTDLPEKMGMKPISAVQVCQYHGERPDQNGLSGYVMIADSHLSIHTWPEHGVVWADFFSCKDFGHDEVVMALVDLFGITKYSKTVLHRGLRWSELMEPQLVTKVVT